MDAVSGPAKGGRSPLAAFRRGEGLLGTLLIYGGLLLVDAFAIWFLVRLISDGVWFLALAVGIVTLLLNVFYLVPGLYPFRWFAPGVVLMILMVLYPAAYTVYIAFTNYADGNLLTKPQAINRLESAVYLPEDALTYQWNAFRNDAGEFLLWLVARDGTQLVAREGAPIVTPDEAGLDVVQEDPSRAPSEIAGYTALGRIQAASDPRLSQVQFGEDDFVVQLRGREAARFAQQYVYDEATDTLTDQQTGVVYRPVQGTFTSDDGQIVRPGYFVPIGLGNFQAFLTSPALRGPFVTVFIWTFVHAAATVFITFVLGLSLALVMNHEVVPAKKIFRSLLLIPYAIPAFISVLVWRGMMNPSLGVVNEFLSAITFGAVSPNWFSSPFWARIGILVIQLWLGFPYMLLICTGALQSIPSDIYEAAEVDGANRFAQFWRLTLPLLLVTLGPLLIASFAFNFNNFTVIELFNKGAPPIPRTATPAGYTDILITYTYRLAFASGRGAQYALATAISIIIFLIVMVITVINFRFTRRLEAISENV